MDVVFKMTVVKGPGQIFTVFFQSTYHAGLIYKIFFKIYIEIFIRRKKISKIATKQFKSFFFFS